MTAGAGSLAALGDCKRDVCKVHAKLVPAAHLEGLFGEFHELLKGVVRGKDECEDAVDECHRLLALAGLDHADCCLQVILRDVTIPVHALLLWTQDRVLGLVDTFRQLVKDLTYISGRVKNSRARGWAYCSHCATIALSSSSERGVKEASFLFELAFDFVFFFSVSLSFGGVEAPPKRMLNGFSEHIRHWNITVCDKLHKHCPRVRRSSGPLG
eukprot:CAMPEP_0197889408 /NCGR_PEP_ID=MMETSP1439-20131203/24327_1 /TAXON_ID=66791 /ORGANISM="Gonyaulax spinifera, Strain CCMP409" /LENGTH=212 /DNA_ID=CAMNT_0043509387 /DNA_START=32 /DNA_END=671 /DNA_ORIENTATION=-